LAADVVGYSRLMEADEEATARTLSTYREIIVGLVASHHGRVFGSAGDSVIAEFASPVEAVRCAVDIQRELEAHNVDLPEDRRMRLRIGINLGDVIVEGDNLLGDGVNIAARLEALAEPGGISLSRPVFDQVRKQLDLGYEYLGEHEVKNIAEPIVVYRVLTAPEDAGRVLSAKSTPSRMRRPATLASIVILGVAAAAGVALWLRPWVPETGKDAEDASAFSQVVRPTRHFRVERPAELADADALSIYDRILDAMVAGYVKSKNPTAAAYRTWRRYNTAPYLSATHGKRYVNNYANDVAKAYGRFEEAGTLPVGSVLAKDSFEVTERGDVVTGPLALMEKMPAGFNPEGRDWRYTTIMPDGSLFGTTNGENAGRVEFCVECHIAAGDEQDHLFFIPSERRVRFLTPGANPD
jgi:class 3 adenylate cyclase